MRTGPALVLLAVMFFARAAAAGDPLIEGFEEARRLLRDRPESGRPERLNDDDYRERTPSGPSAFEIWLRNREIDREQRQYRDREERERVERNRRWIEEGLNTRVHKTSPPKKDTPEQVAARRAILNSIVTIPPTTPVVIVNPTTVRDLPKRDLERLLASKVAQPRRAAILSGQRLQFDLADNPAAQAYPNPWYARQDRELVSLSDHFVQSISQRNGVDADLVRAIIWMESTHGWYDSFLPAKRRGSLLPMNILVDYWSGLGYPRESLSRVSGNVEAGVRVIKEIQARLPNATPERIGTLYHSLGQTKVSDYGKTIAHYYSSKPWLRVRR